MFKTQTQAESTYQKVLKHLQANFKPGQSFTPRKIMETSEFVLLPAHDFTNAFLMMRDNGHIKRSKPNEPVFSNYSVEYELATHQAALNQQALNYVPPKNAEQKEKSDILIEINKIANDLGQLYAKVEKLNTVNNFDLSKVSKEDLINELMSRMSN